MYFTKGTKLEDIKKKMKVKKKFTFFKLNGVEVDEDDVE
jgi:hypothetical protein